MRFLIATVTCGAGYPAAGAAMEEALRAAHPNDVIEKIDLVKLFSPQHRNIYLDGHVDLIERTPELVFAKSDNLKLLALSK